MIWGRLLEEIQYNKEEILKKKDNFLLKKKIPDIIKNVILCFHSKGTSVWERETQLRGSL